MKCCNAVMLSRNFKPSELFNENFTFIKYAEIYFYMFTNKTSCKYWYHLTLLTFYCLASEKVNNYGHFQKKSLKEENCRA